MRLFYSVLCTFFALCASAQSDSIKVRLDFNENPWGLPTCPYGLNSKGKVTYSYPSYEPKESRLDKTTVFEIPACGDKISMTVTPSDLDETDYDNAMVRDENYDNGQVETFLYTYVGSVATFKAPKGYSMAKVAIEVYRTWASGGLYIGDATNNQHVWGPDSVKTRDYEAGGVIYKLQCWSGDSLEWSLPPVTSSTKFRYIDFWLMPCGDPTAVTTVKNENESAEVFDTKGIAVRRSIRRENALEGLPKGVYIIDDKKYVVK